MAEDNLDHRQKMVIEDAKWVDKILTVGAGLAGIIVVAKILSINTLAWNGITVSLTNAWIIFVPLTIAHIYTANFPLSRSICLLWRENLWVNSAEQGRAVFEKVTEAGGIFMHGLVPRTKRVKMFGFYQYFMSSYDPTTPISYGAGLLLILAIVPWNFSNRVLFFLLLAGSIVIVVVNWLIAGGWAVSLSQLTIEPSKATLLQERNEYWKKQEQRDEEQQRKWLEREQKPIEQEPNEMAQKSPDEKI
jgi:hypothetical protein